MVSELALLVHGEPTGKLVTRYAFEAAGAAWGAGIRLEGLEFLALAGRHVRLQEWIRCWGEPALESLVDSSAHFTSPMSCMGLREEYGATTNLSFLLSSVRPYHCASPRYWSSLTWNSKLLGGLFFMCRLLLKLTFLG